MAEPTEPLPGHVAVTDHVTEMELPSTDVTDIPKDETDVPKPQPRAEDLLQG